MKSKSLLFLIFTLILLGLISSEDYYRILGVKRTATEKEIQKAFKNLSIKYHPDKHRNKSDKEKEQAKNMFVKIANAYETLVDPEKRKAYDLGGEEGVKQQEARGSHGHQGHGNFEGSFDDIFSSFFGGGAGGGQRFHFHSNGGGRRMEREEEEVNHFANSDVLNLTISSLSKIYNRNMNWFVLCFKNSNKNIKEVVEMWKVLAEKTYGIFKIGSIDCDKEEELCEEFSVRDTPSILFFHEAEDEHEIYKGEKKWEKIFQFGSNKMQSFVRIVNTDNYGDFITSFQSNHKVILFTSKKVTPPLLKALSKHYQGKLYFGEVRQSEKELIQRYSITAFPSILVVSDAENYKGIPYEGGMNRDSIEKFLNKFAYETIKQEAKSSGVKEFTEETYKKECNHNDSKGICVIKIVNEDEEGSEDISSEDKIKLGLLAEKYKNDPFNFYYVSIKKHSHFWSAFNENDRNSDVIIIKGKRKRYFPVNFKGESNDLSQWESILSEKLDLILSGSGEFKSMVKRIFMREGEGREDL